MRGLASSDEGTSADKEPEDHRRERTVTQEFVQDVFNLSSDVRYVAVSRAGTLTMRERGELASASSAESDRYEELLVNPTLIALSRARGQIDCGGLRFLVVGYGNFHQLVLPIREGHVSIAFESTADPIPFLPRVVGLLETHGLDAVSGASSADQAKPGSTD
jgi:hypothetical protein